MIEIDILHPELQGLGDSRSRAIQHARQHSINPGLQRKYARHFFAREHHRQAARNRRTRQTIQPRQFDIEHFLIEEQD